MKRAVVAGTRAGAQADALAMARQAALSLLARSVTFGHGRLAVIRLSMAVQSGADIPQAHWNVLPRGCLSEQGRRHPRVVPPGGRCRSEPPCERGPRPLTAPEPPSH